MRQTKGPLRKGVEATVMEILRIAVVSLWHEFFFKDINFTLAERSRKQKDISNPSDFAVNSNIFIRLLLMELKRNKKERLEKEKRY